MQQISSFEAAFRFTPPRPRLRAGWLAPGLFALGITLGFGLASDQRMPATSGTAVAAPAAVEPAPAPYASSDPSLPPADTVTFPEPGPHIEAF